MGQSQSLAVNAVTAAVVGGFLYSTFKALARDPTPTSPHGDESFISMEESAEGSQLDGEIERTAEFINNLKRMMADDTHANRKRQLEESLSRAESSFNNLFELKSKLEEYETHGIILGSRVTSEIAKSASQRDIEERLLWSGFGKGTSGLLSGDSSPYKRQRTQTS